MSGTLVLGLGNPLMGDDGVGLAALAGLKAEYEFPRDVRLVDGGTWGMNLLPLIESAERVILLDAIDTAAPPGTLTVLERHELPKYFSHKISPHQIDLREVLALAEWRHTLPAEFVALGIQPERVEMGMGLSPSVERALEALVTLTATRLAEYGLSCHRRRAGAHA
ncbi:MAG TPA: hydrogenase maturation protease [Gemmatimonadales bacterium]|nr:hydrogenase maturation protease [Gemmatimonadales bacterium]